MDEVKKVKNFVLPLYFCGKREVFTFTVSPRSFRSTFVSRKIETGQWNVLENVLETSATLADLLGY